MRRITRRRARGAAILLLILAAAGPGCRRERPPARRLPRQPFGGDFELVDQDNRRFHLHDVHGKAVLLFFGYTSCPDMCPATMSRIASALERLGPDRSKVVTVFVSVDPDRDSPAVLKEYAASFSTPLIALTGSADAISRTARTYHASYERVDGGSSTYLINHTTAIFLVDAQGALREYFAYNERPERLAAAVRSVLTDD